MQNKRYLAGCSDISSTYDYTYYWEKTDARNVPTRSVKYFILFLSIFEFDILHSLRNYDAISDAIVRVMNLVFGTRLAMNPCDGQESL